MKKLSIFIVVLLGLLVGVWFGLSAYNTQKAEEALNKLNDDYQLTQYVQWGSVKVTPLGKVTLSDIKVLALDNMHIDKVIIHDWTNELEEKSLHLELLGVSDAVGGVPLHWLKIDESLLQKALKPLDLTLNIDLYDQRKEARFLLGLKEDTLGTASLNVELGSVQAWSQLFPAFKDLKKSLFGVLFLADRLSEKIYLKSLTLDADDRSGLAPRWLTLWDRYSHVPMPEEPRLDAFQKLEKNCRVIGLVEEKACQTLSAFLQAKKSTITLMMQAKEPLFLKTLMKKNVLEAQHQLNLMIE